MRLLYDIIDLKLTALYSFMIFLLNEKNIKLIYFVISAIIYIGYNLHRWWIMNQEYKKRNQGDYKTKRK